MAADRKLDGPVKPEEARLLLAKREAAAIDLREDDAPQTGYAPGAAVVVDGDTAEAVERARAGMDVPVLVFCEDGKRSEQVAEELEDAGIEAAPVEGGWEKWIATGQPVQPRPDEEFEGPDLSTQPGT